MFLPELYHIVGDVGLDLGLGLGFFGVGLDGLELGG